MTEERNRQAMPVENLLIWAYCDQMVHRARQLPVEIANRGGAPLAAYSSLWEEGAPVENTRSNGFDASDDAWRIHEEVMRLKKLTVDCGQDLAATRYHALRQYRGAEPPLGGAGVDVTARGPVSPRPWPTNGLLVLDVGMLVMMHASKATRPERPAKATARFKPEDMVRHPRSKGGVYKLGWYQHVSVIGDTAGEVREAQETYQAWHTALDQLRRQLQAVTLTMFTVTDALPPPLKKTRVGA